MFILLGLATLSLLEKDIESEILNELFSTGGMIGMLNTIFLVMATMIFGGSMDAIGAIKSISKALLNWADNIFKLFVMLILIHF